MSYGYTETKTITRDGAERHTVLVTRPATMDDAEAVTDVLNACSIELIGLPTWETHEFVNDWQNPTVNLQTDSLVVVTTEGRLVAYADVWDQAPHVRIYSMGRVHPDFRGNGIGTRLCRWIEERARRSIDLAPEGSRVALMQHLLASDAPADALLRAMGFWVIRYSYQMRLEMQGPPPEPAVPPGIVIRPMIRHQEEPAIVHADRDAFKDHWGYVESPFEDDLKQCLHWMENDPLFDPSIWFLAMDGDKVAGLSLCYPRTTEDPDMGWVSTLGVRRRWRRQGLGLALLQHSFGEFYRRGRRKVGLGVDASSLTGATRLYERAGMHVHRQFASYEKELRPGVELSTQSVQS